MRTSRTHADWLTAARVTPFIPEAVSGRWKVERFTVTEDEARLERLRSFISSSSRGRGCPAGEYTRLMRGGVVVMSDTPDEINDLMPLRFALRSSSRVLIHGLGLGCALRLVLSDRHVGHIDVVEIDPDVIALVGQHFADGSRLRCESCGLVDLVHHATGDAYYHCSRKMTTERFRDLVAIHEGDAYTFKFPPGTSWDVAWHDVWDTISADNDFATLHRRYGRRVRWQGSWCRDEAQRAW